MTKKSKASVQYDVGDNVRRCGLCAHFRTGTGTCALVDGRIDKYMVCKLFKKR